MSSNVIKFSKDELQAPEWMNEQFFLVVLKNNESTSDINITNLKISPATVKGDHFASVMFRVLVDYCLNGKDKQKSMILKTMPECEGIKKDLLKETHLFETEIGIYTEVIPKFESILRSIDDETILGPKCLYHSLSPKKVIIFEDIVPLGYEVLQGCSATLEEIKAAYTKLAKWHALSHKIILEEPLLFDKYRHGIFTDDSMKDSPFFKNSITNFITLLENHEDLKMYKKYFKSLENNGFSQCEAAFHEYRENRQSSGIYVLCHGDFHCKNMMFKRNTETKCLDDVMLLDYQLCYVGPIGNDIMYSRLLLLSSEQRVEHFDEIQFHYITVFQETLQKIKFKGKIPKIFELRHELCRHKNFELYLMCTFLPVWEPGTSGEIDFEDLLGSVDNSKDFYSNKKYLEELRRLLPKYLYKGYLEN